MKKRLDQILMERNLFPSWEKARSAIMTGRILIKGKKETKAGTMVPEDAVIEMIGNDLPYVSRGGLKLEKAVDCYQLDFKGKNCLGYWRVDRWFYGLFFAKRRCKSLCRRWGYGQLAWSLRNDDRVIVLEKTNARYLSKEQIPEPVDYIVIDASFISQKN